MKKEVEDIMVWINELIKKFGLLVFICFAVWMGIKKVWFWAIMPIMFLVFLKQGGLLFNWAWVSQLNEMYLVISWVFIFSLLKGLGGMLFEKT